MKSSSVYRHEEKYIISQKEAYYLKKYLYVCCKRDNYGSDKDGKYWIRSLYFDTYFSKDYEEKIIGICNRKKIRLRIYDIESQVAKLEIKNKMEQYSFKESLEIKIDDAVVLAKGNIDVLLEYNNDIANKAYYHMKSDNYLPKKIIDYKREAYTYSVENVRITFDNELYGCDSFDLLKQDLPLYPILKEQMCILEVKYDRMLPAILRKILSTTQLYRDSFSKYCSSYYNIL